MSYVVYDTVVGALTLKQVRSSNFSPNVQHFTARAAGASAPSEISVVQAQPQASFVTGDLGGVIGGTSTTAGLLVSSGTITIPWNQRSNGGAFTSGTNHWTLSATDGLLMPTSVSASQGDPAGASVECTLYPVSTDGETSPIASNTSQALASAAFNAMYEFGPVSINGTQLTKAISSRVDYGVPVAFEQYDGDHYPQYVFIDAENIEPMITITFANVAALDSYGPLFASMTACAVHYRKRSDGGSTVSDASTVHARYSFAGGLAVVGSLTGENAQTGQASITLHGKALTASVAAVSL